MICVRLSENAICDSKFGVFAIFDTLKHISILFSNTFTHLSPTTCIPDWEAENGQCVPLKCANPRDLTDNNGNLIGWPAGTAKAGCGESIEYECAEGMMADMSNAADSTRSRPYSNCDDNADYPNEQEGERGSQGFFSAVQGTCVRKY